MTPPRTTLMVVRHGETEWNAQQRFQGHGDSPLTPKGRSDVRALGRRLKHISFDHLISSDLGRARETAALIAEQTGHTIVTDPLLRERNYGVFEGLTIPEIKSRHSESFQRLVEGDPDAVIPQGESHRQHYERNIRFMERFMQDHAGTTALLAVHGGVLDSLLRFVTGLPLDYPRCFTAVNASLNVFVHGNFFRTHRWVVETWGDVSHLTLTS
jgi:2,3-bisphosphoglycerate-dependent phosphoglycerate mutase